MLKMQIISLVFSLTIIFFTFEMVRKKKIKEEYSILWFFMGIVALLFSLYPGFMDILGHLFGISYAPALLLLALFVFVLLVLIHISIVLSRLQNQAKDLIQEVGLLKKELDEIKAD